MNKEQTTLEIINGIYDIQPPIVPAISPLETTILLFILIAFISAIVFTAWKVLYSNKGRAKRKIKELQLEYSDNKINAHDTIYQLSFILSHGLRINHISSSTLLPEKINSNKNNWDAFTKKLSALRYKKEVKPHSDINELFKDSLLWLKLWP